MNGWIKLINTMIEVRGHKILSVSYSLGRGCDLSSHDLFERIKIKGKRVRRLRGWIFELTGGRLK